ncbi:MAG: SpoIVB peptidase [Oscillospiraceae bacterium]|nr:SpoIVB peptidase [Oscillospiraceae bacterium]
MYRRIIKSILVSAGLLSCICSFTATKVPDIINITYGQKVDIQSVPLVSLYPVEKAAPARQMSTSGSRVTYSARLLGIIPIKDVAVISDNQRYVAVSGRPFGIKMFCDGVMVVGFSDILTATGYKNPAKLAGLKAGDIIVSMNSKTTRTNKDVEKIITSAENNKIKVSYIRGDEQHSTTLTAVKDTAKDSWRSGMWVRDSGAGIGTMTFYELDKGYFAGLGHGIKDVDTHQELRLLSGEIVPVKITGLTKSKNGTAGQLKGSFMTTIASGKILHNGATGVYGKAYITEKDNLMAVATPAEIHTGKATILTTINGTQPREYEIEIEKVNLTTSDANKNMVIRITDSRLLTLTGGIVAGFSGSPIIQDGQLVGAVTHVFVNQVDKGYGIFATNMLDTLDSIIYENEKPANAA